ncbi:MAG: V-type ATP synthase subunit F [Candidatus Gracilibacteria bacterium]|jgi:V/A-type H+-transporting ATPase subunit F|nr:V-type ATP synthase subunit F [Candidatus Gracilibacteria bacterium]
MAKSHKIAIIGNKETILGFKALGIETFGATNREEAIKMLFDLKNKEQTTEAGDEKESKYAIIFITEDLAQEISKEEYQKLSKHALPAIIPVPSSKGTSGYGLKRIGKIIEMAIGSDIIK